MRKTIVRKTKKKSAVQLTIFSGLVCSSSWLAAAPNLDVTVGADLEYHDNAALVSEDEKSDLDRVARARVDYTNPGGSLPITLGYLAERHDFVDDVEEDRTRIDGAANAKWFALPNLLDFDLTHQISDQLQDRRAADVNTNRERRSIVSAGANLYGHLSKVDTISLSPRYTDVNLQSSSGSDSEHVSAALAWRHALNAVSALQLTGTRERVRFDDSINDYDATRGLLSYNTRLSRLTYSVGGGYNRIERDDRRDANGYTVQLAADYVENAYTWGGSLIRQLTDSAIGLSGFENTLTNFRAEDGNVDVPDIVESTQADLHVQRQISASHNVRGSVGYVRQDYKDTLRDENSYFALAGYEYSINPLWMLGVTARYENSEFPDDPSDLEQKDKQLDLSLAYRHSERLTARFAVGREQRDANVAVSEYTDNYALISVNFLLY